MLLEAAEAEQGVPLALAALLNDDQLSRVKQLGLSNFAYADSNAVCTSCPKSIVVDIDATVAVSPTLIHLRQSGGIQVTVDKGIIHVKNLAEQNPNTTFMACGEATCSSVKIAGVNVPELKKLAARLRYSSIGRRKLHCVTKKPHPSIRRV